MSIRSLIRKADVLMEPLAHVTRGALTECTHYGDIAVCDARGRLVAAVGDPARCVYWRSSAKPIQALGVIHSGAADAFPLSAKEISVCCASHCGSEDHVATVRGILEKIGLDESSLQCGTQWPSDTAERNRLIKEDLQPSPLHNNCSGKHAGMLASALAMEADPATYLQLGHPVQQTIISNLSALSGTAPDEFVIGVDGCGAPTHGMSIQAMATAFARLCWPDEMPERIQRASPRIIAAMAADPVMVSARGSFNSELLAAAAGRIVAKGGAEGLFVLGLTQRGLGVAIRTVDGGARGHSAVAMRVLDQLGALDESLAEALESFITPPVRNCHGEVVGEIKAADFELSVMNAE